MSAILKSHQIGLTPRDTKTLNQLANKLFEVGSGDTPLRTKWAYRIRVSSQGLSDAESQALADYSILTMGSLISTGKTSLQASQQLLSSAGTPMSFSTQYLQLQNSMQNDNRQFTMVSNIMKTKHDTVKNSISNVR